MIKSPFIVFNFFTIFALYISMSVPNLLYSVNLLFSNTL